MGSSTPPLHIAIIGGGIAGLALAIGLHTRGIAFTVHERAAAIQEVGAGIGLSPNAERALRILAPAAQAAYNGVANPNGEDYFQWVNGVSNELMFKLFVGEGAFRGCRRSDLLEAMATCLPPGCIKFGRSVESVEEKQGGRGVVMRFSDGSEEVADTVIASDGIHSRLRAHLFPSPPNPPTTAIYSRKSSFRALIPMPDARAVLGSAMVSTRFMYNGPGAHIITYPVASDTLLNVLVVISAPDPSPSSPTTATQQHTADDIQRAFAATWHPNVAAIVGLLPPAEMARRWDIFDMHERAAPRYHEGGAVCLVGDAAHAVGPHLGAGAGFGIEDAALLAELLKDVQEGVVAGGAEEGAGGGRGVTSMLEAAYTIFTEMRYERTQWLVRETREAVDLFEWEKPEVATDPEAFGREISWRFHEIWDYDVGKMVEDGRAKLAAALQEMGMSM